MIVLVQKFFHNFGIFFRLKAASACKSKRRRILIRRGKLEQIQLRLLQARNFLPAKSASANPRAAA